MSTKLTRRKFISIIAAFTLAVSAISLPTLAFADPATGGTINLSAEAQAGELTVAVGGQLDLWNDEPYENDDSYPVYYSDLSSTDPEAEGCS